MSFTQKENDILMRTIVFPLLVYTLKKNSNITGKQGKNLKEKWMPLSASGSLLHRRHNNKYNDYTSNYKNNSSSTEDKIFHLLLSVANTYVPFCSQSTRHELYNLIIQVYFSDVDKNNNNSNKNKKKELS